MKLQDYNFTLCYILEKTNTKANILSRKNQVVEEITLLEEIQRNNTRKQEVVKELEKNNSQHGKKMELSIWKKGYIFQITRRYESKYYKKTTI